MATAHMKGSVGGASGGAGGGGGIGEYESRELKKKQKEEKELTVKTEGRSITVIVSEVDLSDVKNKKDLVYHAVITPEGVPNWAKDYKTLWREVANYENENNNRWASAQYVRKFIIALPRELSEGQNIELVKEYVAAAFVSRGMGAQVDIHESIAKDGKSNPHVHILLTMRSIDENGFSKKKDRSWNSKATLKQWRDSWVEHTNRAYERAGLGIRIDPRTYKEQGIELVPMVHLGGKNDLRSRNARIEENRLIARENGERILSDPNIALKALTAGQATFTDRDLERFVRAHSDGDQQYQDVLAAVREDKRVMRSVDETGLVKYTTSEMLATEFAIARSVKDLTNRKGEGGVKWISADYLNAEQDHAGRVIVGAGDIKLIEGYAGTGKSTMLDISRESWEHAGYTVKGATVSATAAKELEKSSGIESRTIASMILSWDNGNHLTHKDVLVIDEAGMVSTRDMARILAEVNTYNAKLVLVGDPMQLSPIGAGDALRLVTKNMDEADRAELTHVHRQREAWMKEATYDFAHKDVRHALDRYHEHGYEHAEKTRDKARQAIVEKWNADRVEHLDKTQVMMAFRHVDVDELNTIARMLLKKDGIVGEDHKIQTERGERLFAEGDRLIFLKNDRDRGVTNGTLGTIEKIKGDTMAVRLDPDEKGQAGLVTFDIKEYNQIDYGYALTIHKEQGATVDKAYVLADKMMDNRLIYVAMSRHRERVELYYGKDDFSNREQMKASMSRVTEKELASDRDWTQKPEHKVEQALSPEEKEQVDRLIKETGYKPMIPAKTPDFQTEETISRDKGRAVQSPGSPERVQTTVQEPQQRPAQRPQQELEAIRQRRKEIAAPRRAQAIENILNDQFGAQRHRLDTWEKALTKKLELYKDNRDELGEKYGIGGYLFGRQRIEGEALRNQIKEYNKQDMKWTEEINKERGLMNQGRSTYHTEQDILQEALKIAQQKDPRAKEQLDRLKVKEEKALQVIEHNRLEKYVSSRVQLIHDQKDLLEKNFMPKQQQQNMNRVYAELSKNEDAMKIVERDHPDLAKEIKDYQQRQLEIERQHELEHKHSRGLSR